METSTVGVLSLNATATAGEQSFPMRQLSCRTALPCFGLPVRVSHSCILPTALRNLAHAEYTLTTPVACGRFLEQYLLQCAALGGTYGALIHQNQNPSVHQV